jgi:hypothetical protein
MSDTCHVVTEDGQELDVTYEVDEDTGSERVTAKGFKRFDGEDFEGELMAPKGRPAVGYQWFAVGTASNGQTYHFVTAPVKSIDGDDTPIEHEVPHVVERHGDPGAAPKDLAEKTAGVKQSDAQKKADEKKHADPSKPEKRPTVRRDSHGE